MPAFATIVLKDSAAANINFTPLSLDGNGVASYIGTTSDSAAIGSINTFEAKRKASTSVTLPKNGSKVVRVKQKVVVPVFDSVSPYTKLGDATCNIEFVVPAAAGQGDLTDLVAHAKDMIALSLTASAVTAFEPVY
jgi:hypothetical protein